MLLILQIWHCPAAAVLRIPERPGLKFRNNYESSLPQEPVTDYPSSETCASIGKRIGYLGFGTTALSKLCDLNKCLVIAKIGSFLEKIHKFYFKCEHTYGNKMGTLSSDQHNLQVTRCWPDQNKSDFGWEHSLSSHWSSFLHRSNLMGSCKRLHCMGLPVENRTPLGQRKFYWNSNNTVGDQHLNTVIRQSKQ